jgi:hypothetical protein
MPRRRAGRKRKLDAVRTPNGRAVSVARIDRGTVELRAHRRALAGDGDPTKTTCPLDILVDRGVIIGDAARAVCWFRRLATGLLGRPHPRGSLSEPAGEPEAERIARLSRAYAHLAGRLSAAERSLLLDIAFFERLPPWLARVIAGLPLGPADAAAKQEAMQAIGRLLNAWLGRAGGAAE